MKNTHRRITAVLLAVLLSVEAVGCGHIPDAEKEPDPVTITVWTKDRHDLKFQQEKIKEFNQNNLDGITVKYEVYSGNYSQAVDNAVMNQEMPDILAYTEDVYNGLRDRNLLVDLNTCMDEKFRSDFESVMVEGINVEDGKCYFLPTGLSTVRLIYNKEIFERAGIAEPPKTIDEMIEDAALIQQKLGNEGIYGFAANMKEAFSALSRTFLKQGEYAEGIRCGYDFAEGKYEFERYTVLVEKWRRLLSEECSCLQSSELSIDPLRELFAEGRIGMYITYGYSEQGIYENQFSTEIEWDYAPLPVLDGASKGAGSYVLNGGYLLSNKSGHMEEAWKVYTSIFADISNLTEHYEAGLSVSAIPEVRKQAEQDGYQMESLLQPTEAEKLWPKAPHERWKRKLQIEGNDWAETIKELIYSDTEIEPVLKQLSERYNKVYEEAVDYRLCEPLVIRDFDPMHPALQYDEYEE